MTEFGQAACVTAGAARGVQGCTGCDGVQDGPDDGLLEVDEGIAGVVVGLRPASVAAGNVHDRYISTQLVDGLAAAGDTPDLGQPCRRLRIVVEQMTHERDSLDSEQELANTQMPDHPLRMPDFHRARTPALPRVAGRLRGVRTGPAQPVSLTAGPPWEEDYGARTRGPELFERAQKVLDPHSGSGTRTRSHNHYLKDVLYCGRCAYRFIMQRAQGNGGEHAEHPRALGC